MKILKSLKDVIKNLKITLIRHDGEEFTLPTGIMTDHNIEHICSITLLYMKKAFEAGRKTHCATDTSLYYETFEEFIEEENE